MMRMQKIIPKACEDGDLYHDDGNLYHDDNLPHDDICIYKDTLDYDDVQL